MEQEVPSPKNQKAGTNCNISSVTSVIIRLISMINYQVLLFQPSLDC